MMRCQVLRRTFAWSLLLLAATWVILAPETLAQTPSTQATSAPAVAYDVVSIRQNKSGTDDVSIWTRDSTLNASNVPLVSLLSIAYGIRNDLISGLPGWAESARFDVNAKIVDPDMDAIKKLKPEQRRAMLVPTMTDRFHAKVHTETRILPVYELGVLKSGPRFKENPRPMANPDPAKPETGPSRGGTRIHNYDMTATAVTMSSLASTLAGQLNRTVIDKTGLQGEYDLHMKWTPEQVLSAASDAGQHASDEAPSIFTALQEQLGLKLQPTKGPVETLVVDHIEMPTEN